MSCLCLGCVLGVYWMCLGCNLGVSLACLGCLECVLVVYWLCLGCVLVVSSSGFGCALAESWLYLVVSFKVSSDKRKTLIGVALG